MYAPRSQRVIETGRIGPVSAARVYRVLPYCSRRFPAFNKLVAQPLLLPQKHFHPSPNWLFNFVLFIFKVKTGCPFCQFLLLVFIGFYPVYCSRRASARQQTCCSFVLSASVVCVSRILPYCPLGSFSTHLLLSRLARFYIQDQSKMYVCT